MADECAEADGELVDVSKVSVPCEVASGDLSVVMVILQILWS